MRELHHVPVFQDDRAGRFPHRPDGTIAPPFGRELLPQPGNVSRAHREAQLIVIAAGESELPRALIANRFHQGFRDR